MTPRVAQVIGSRGSGADTGPERSGGQPRGAPQAAESQSLLGAADP